MDSKNNEMMKINRNSPPQSQHPTGIFAQVLHTQNPTTALKTQVSQNASKIAQLEAENERLEQELSQAQARIQELEKKQKEITEGFEEAIRAKEQQANKLKEEIASLKSSEVSYLHRIQELEKKQREADEEIASLKSSEVSYLHRIQELEKKQKEITEEFDKISRAKEQQANKLKEEIASLKLEVATIQTQRTRTEAKLKGQEKINELNDARLTELEAQLLAEQQSQQDQQQQIDWRDRLLQNNNAEEKDRVVGQAALDIQNFIIENTIGSEKVIRQRHIHNLKALKALIDSGAAAFTPQMQANWARVSRICNTNTNKLLDLHETIKFYKEKRLATAHPPVSADQLQKIANMYFKDEDGSVDDEMSMLITMKRSIETSS